MPIMTDMPDLNDPIETAPKPKKEKSPAPTPTYYVLHGEDDYSRKAEVAAFLKRMGSSPEATMNTSRMDGTQVTVSTVLACVRAMPFLSDKRLVIVDGLLSHLTRKGAGKVGSEALDMLIATLPTLPDWARLILHEPGKLAAGHPIFKLLQADSRGFQKAFEPLRDDALNSWIARRVASEQGTIEPDAVRQLAMLVGGDLRALESEIFKLVLYTNNERSIRAADVALMVAGAPEVTLFQLVDALGGRNGKQAITLLHILLDARQEPLAILGMVNRQFRLLLQIKSHLGEGGNPNELERVLNMKSWQIGNLNKQATKFTLPVLEAIYRQLLQIDIQIKTGQIDGVLALDTFIAALTG